MIVLKIIAVVIAVVIVGGILLLNSMFANGKNPFQ